MGRGQIRNTFPLARKAAVGAGLAPHVVRADWRLEAKGNITPPILPLKFLEIRRGEELKEGSGPLWEVQVSEEVRAERP